MFPLYLVKTLSNIVVKSPLSSFGNPYPKSKLPVTFAPVPEETSVNSAFEKNPDPACCTVIARIPPDELTDVTFAVALTVGAPFPAPPELAVNTSPSE